MAGETHGQATQSPGAGRGWQGLSRQTARRAGYRRQAYASAGGKTQGGAGPALIRSDTA